MTFFRGNRPGERVWEKIAGCQTPLFTGQNRLRAWHGLRPVGGPKPTARETMCRKPLFLRAIQRYGALQSAETEFFPWQSALAKRAPRGHSAENTAFYGAQAAFARNAGCARKTRKSEPPEKNCSANPCFYATSAGVLPPNRWGLLTKEQFAGTPKRPAKLGLRPPMRPRKSVAEEIIRPGRGQDRISVVTTNRSLHHWQKASRPGGFCGVHSGIMQTVR